MEALLVVGGLLVVGLASSLYDAWRRRSDKRQLLAHPDAADLSDEQRSRALTSMSMGVSAESAVRAQFKRRAPADIYEQFVNHPTAVGFSESEIAAAVSFMHDYGHPTSSGIQFVETLRRGRAKSARESQAAAEAAEQRSRPPRAQRIAGWRDAERAAVRWMKENGFENVGLTQPGRDTGIDIRADDAVAQVKFRSIGRIGRPDVQRFRGAAGASPQCLFFACTLEDPTRSFTKEAYHFACSRRIELYAMSADGSCQRIN